MNELLELLQEFRKILCICPCCGEIVRVSDLRLKIKGTTIKTWLDNYQKKEQDILKKEERFDEREGKLREIATEKGRKEAEKVFNKAISKAVLPSFGALKLDPFDIKPLLHPIDFVVFKGMNKRETISDIIFLSRKYKILSLNLLRQQIQKVISQKKYEWQVARIDENGKIVFE